MLVSPKTEELLEKVDNRYELVIAVSKRSRQLINGSSPMSKVKNDEKSEITIASIELKEGKFEVMSNNR